MEFGTSIAVLLLVLWFIAGRETKKDIGETVRTGSGFTRESMQRVRADAELEFAESLVDRKLDTAKKIEDALKLASTARNAVGGK